MLAVAARVQAPEVEIVVPTAASEVFERLGLQHA